MERKMKEFESTELMVSQRPAPFCVCLLFLIRKQTNKKTEKTAWPLNSTSLLRVLFFSFPMVHFQQYVASQPHQKAPVVFPGRPHAKRLSLALLPSLNFLFRCTGNMQRKGAKRRKNKIRAPAGKRIEKPCETRTHTRRYTSPPLYVYNAHNNNERLCFKK